ncbi:MAG TPA: hydroxymethylglutaryl-CoA lyase [Burkholderiaceae bacterium]|nr:hydroxymethylglutaryl-CoA lyase [Burkholderiaceae bacterium]
MTPSPLIQICDVGPRDGLQNESRFVPTADKVALIDRLSHCGLARIEVTSFVSPKAIPQLADAEQVMQAIERVPGVEYTVLVPNLRGAERALACRPDELNIVMSVSESHNRANLKMSREASFDALSSVVALAARNDTPINVSLSCCFGCPFEGDVAGAEVLGWVDRFTKLGVTAFTLCDTTGMAYPSQVRRLAAEVRERFPRHLFTMHFHNTRSLGVANVLTAAAAGIERFDASLGGLGGCPYAPGASGNVCTEDAVHALHLEGFRTGVDLDALIDSALSLPPLIGHDIPGQLAHAGPRLRLHALSDAKAQ